MNLLNLVRWKNLLIIAFVQFLIKYALLEPFTELTGVTTSLQPIGFILLVIATLCIAAAGYIINDIYDVTADKINKPDKVIIGQQISEKRATVYFILLNVIGVGLGYFISFQVGQSDLFVIFVIISGLLYAYSAYLKRYLIIGDVVVSAFVAMSILLVGIFELLPALNDNNRDVQLTFFEIIFDYALFGFMINLVRELVKDIEDTKGDKIAGYQSLSIAFGIKNARLITFALNLVNIALIIAYLVEYFYKNNLVVIYFLGLIIGPLIFVSIRLLQAKEKEQFGLISSLLKVIMFTGVCSMLVFNLSQS
jgi:4-hydroxybenzoate polyprenyltransferase